MPVSKAMSNGLPVITTDIGAEGIGLTDGLNASVVTGNTDEFADKIVQLYSDKILLGKLSRNSIEHVRKNFSIENAKNKVRGMLGEM